MAVSLIASLTSLVPSERSIIKLTFSTKLSAIALSVKRSNRKSQHTPQKPKVFASPLFEERGWGESIGI